MTADLTHQGTSLSDGAGGLEGGGLTNKCIFQSFSIFEATENSLKIKIKIHF